MILLSAHQITKTFADRTLFQNVSFGVDEKERIGMVGPNGSGKSTLLKILSGEITPDKGSISKKRGLKVGFLEQTPIFEPGATILSTISQKCENQTDSISHCYELMAKLNLSYLGAETEVSTLSGGWQKRVALARELAVEPELLLLDEPTNHLDLTSILWLENFLGSSPFSLIMVTHDRLFLQRVANRIFDLDPRNPNYLLATSGDYSNYLETKEIELAALQRHEQVEKNRLRRETEWLRRGSQARQTKQSARIQAAGELKDTVRDLKNKNQSRQVDLNFGETEHSPKKLIEAIDLSKRYGSQVLFEDLNILIGPKTRLGLLGDNGCGKSTLIKILLEMERPDSGRVKKADGIETAYFEQSRETLNPELSVLRNICPLGDHVFFQGNHIHVRSYLDRFFFTGQKVDLAVKKLSGGEQARLRLAQLMLRPSQILVLDEPTNDLDTAMLESLEKSLNEFNGAVILVTHDRYFLDAVANQILAFPPPAFADRRLQTFANYFQWESWYQSESYRTQMSAKKTDALSSTTKKTRMSFKEKFELENIENVILGLESEMANLQKESQDPDIISNHKRLTDILTRIAELQSQIEAKYQRWSELETK